MKQTGTDYQRIYHLFDRLFWVGYSYGNQGAGDGYARAQAPALVDY